MTSKWTKKEKPLTLEEALLLAKKEYAPFWIGSPPLLVGIQNGGKCTAHPIEPELMKKVWLGLFVDPTYPEGTTALQFILQLSDRYSFLGLLTLVFINFKYKSFQTKKMLEGIFSQFISPQIIYSIDLNGYIAKAFEMLPSPGLLVMSHGHIALSRGQKNWYQKTDLELQKFFRKSDPGLALLPVLENPKLLFKNSGELEFGKNFTSSQPFEISGSWTPSGESTTTQDAHAVLKFTTQSTHVMLIGGIWAGDLSSYKLLDLLNRGSEIQIELDGRPIHEAAKGEDVKSNSDGQTIIMISQTRTYQVLKDLPADKTHSVTISFADSKFAPVELYGIRFGIKV